MQIAMQGDALISLNLESDTSLLIASGLSERGCKIFWYHPSTLSCKDGEVFATGRYIDAKFTPSDDICLSYKETSEEVTIGLDEFHCIMIRQNPPVDMHYIASTHFLSLIKKPNILYINCPQALRDNVEKLLPIALDLPRPPTLISNSVDQIKDFLHQHETIVLKAIYDYGGSDVIKISLGNEDKIEEFLRNTGGLQIIAQQFLPQIYNGDKRVIICGGKVLGCVARIPGDNSFLTNGRMGGSPKQAKMTSYESTLCQEIANKLKSKNIFLAGVDLIGDYVTEINITSPTLLVALTKYDGLEPLNTVIESIVRASCIA